MKYQKANIEICTALARGDRVVGHDVNGNYFFVTANGNYGFIFPKKTIVFDLKKVKKLEKALFCVDDMVADQNRITPTEYHFIPKETRLVFRRFIAPGSQTWVNVSFLKYFESPTYFQKEGQPLTPILVIENKGRENIPVAVLLPARINES